MSRDVYAWIDPFEEIERAREDGRMEVVRCVEMDNEDTYRRLLSGELHYLANEHARRTIASMGLRKNIEQAALEIAEQATRRAVDLQFVAMNPTLRIYPHEHDGKLSLDFSSAESFTRLSQ